MTPREIAERLTSDSAWNSLSESEQDEAFQTALKRSSSQQTVQPDVVKGFFGDVPADRFEAGERNIAGNLIERPAAAARGAIRGNPFLAALGPLAGVAGITGAGGREAQERAQQASLNPATERSFQTEAIDRYYQDVARRQPEQAPNFAQVLGGTIPSGAGFAADIALSPMDALLTALGLTPQARRAATAVASSRPGQAAGQFLQRDIQSFMPGKKLTEPLSTMFKIGRPSTIAKPSPFREALISRVQNRLLKSPKLAGREFEEGLEAVVTAHPDQRVDLSGPLTTFLDQAKKNPAFDSMIRRITLNNTESGFVQSLLNQPGAAANLTLQDSQMVKQIFQRVLKQKFEQVGPDLWGAHLDALDVWHSIRAAQLQAFPQFKGVLGAYRETLQSFRTIKNALKEGALESKLMSNFGKDSQMIKAFRELATEDTIKLIEKLQKATAMRTFLKRLGLAGIGVAATQTPLGRKVVGSLLPTQ